MHYFGDGGSMGFGGIWMVLWWILLIVGVVFLMKWIGGDKGGPRTERGALEILEERYARGEIDQTEFEQKRRELEQ